VNGKYHLSNLQYNNLLYSSKIAHFFALFDYNVYIVLGLLAYNIALKSLFKRGALLFEGPHFFPHRFCAGTRRVIGLILLLKFRNLLFIQIIH
jgi:hypothetical protein